MGTTTHKRIAETLPRFLNGNIEVGDLEIFE